MELTHNSLNNPGISQQANSASKHLDYSRVKEFLEKTKDKISKNEKVIFYCIGASLHHIPVPDTFKYPKANQGEFDLNWQAKYKPFIENPVFNKAASLCYSGAFARELSKIHHHAELTEMVSGLRLASPVTNYHSLLSKQLADTKIIGDFTFAYVEARANHFYREKYLSNKAIDHYWSAEGLINIDLFADVLKANETPKDDLVVLAVPANAIKAFCNEKFGVWEEVECEQVPSSFANGKLYEYDKYGNHKADLKLIEHHPKNLYSPIYKIRSGEYWIIVVPVSENAYGKFSNSLDKGGFTKAVENRLTKSGTKGFIEIQADYNFVEEIVKSTEHGENIEKALNYDLPANGIISCSIGEAARTSFELMGGFDNIPEALFFQDGGSASSVATEKNSDGRHLGVHDMHKILKNGWHSREDVAIPWQLIAGDLLDSSNEHILDDENVFILSPEMDNTKSLKEKKVFLEAPQEWKPIANDVLKHFIKAIYAEYTILATRKYHINIRDSAELVASYLGLVAIYDNKIDAKNFKEELAKLEVAEELEKFLQMLGHIHFAACSSADYYSAKTHPHSIIRLQWLAKAHKEFKSISPNLAMKFEEKIREICKGEVSSEFTTLENLYFSELNKISD